MVEAGDRVPSDELVVRLARVLEIDPLAAITRAVRDRLPPELRDLAPLSAGSNREAARLHALECFDYEIARLEVTLTANAAGDIRILRRYTDLKPRLGRTLRIVRFAERAAPSHLQVPVLKPISQPDDVFANTHSEASADGAWHRHRIEFPRGWERKTKAMAEGMTFDIEVARKGVFSLRGQDIGSYNYTNVQPTLSLRIALDIVNGAEAPSEWLPITGWLGGGEFDATRDNQIDKCCRSYSVERTTNSTTVEIVEPLLHATIAIPWRMD